MFAGIGGLRSGFSHYGDFFVPVGYCEIDPYAKKAYEAIYEPKGEIYFEDARGIVPESLPDIDLICGGFPCQSFSIAGKRGGFEDARGTLFFEIARIARVKRPHFLLLENVPGLLSHDGCRTFATILGTLDELGYTVIAQCYPSLRAVAQSNRRSQVRQLLLSCDIKTVNTVVLITEIGRRYRKAKFKRRILHPERVLLEWSDFVYLGGTKENAIAYLTKKRDFLSSFIYGLERLTYNLIRPTACGNPQVYSEPPHYVLYFHLICPVA